MSLLSVKKRKKHIQFNFLCFKFKFRVYLKKKFPAPVLVIICSGGIGDYILQRHYFKYIKMSQKYNNAYVILVVNNKYFDFVKMYDTQYFDEIIPHDVAKMNNYSYSKEFISKINSYNPDDIYLISDIKGIKKNGSFYYSMCKKIKANNKYIGTSEYDPLYKDKVFNKILYDGVNDCTLPLKIDTSIRNQFKQLLNMDINDGTSDFVSVFNGNKKRIAISVFSTEKKRMLKMKYWIEIINFILNNTDNNYEIIFLGTKSEEKMIKTLKGMADMPDRCINMAGRINISLIPLLLKQCELLISVESGNIHIAHDVGCKSICLAGSFYYGLYHPYTDNIVKYIYPEKFIDYLNTMQQKENVYTPPRTISA